jgi:hypothetical protein
LTAAAAKQAGPVLKRVRARRQARRVARCKMHGRAPASWQRGWIDTSHLGGRAAPAQTALLKHEAPARSMYISLAERTLGSSTHETGTSAEMNSTLGVVFSLTLLLDGCAGEGGRLAASRPACRPSRRRHPAPHLPDNVDCNFGPAGHRAARRSLPRHRIAQPAEPRPAGVDGAKGKFNSEKRLSSSSASRGRLARCHQVGRRREELRRRRWPASGRARTALT